MSNDKTTQQTRLERWRLLLGRKADPHKEVQLEETAQGMDDVMEALYDSEREGGLGASSPKVHRWLSDVQRYFPSSVAQVLQKDAIDRLGIEEILRSEELTEQLQADVHLASTIVALKALIPKKSKESARRLVEKVVRELEKRLKNPMREAIQGALHRSARNRRPKWNEIDWHKTIRKNLKHYQQDLNTIIPEQLIGYGKKGSSLKEVILLCDQSGSMSESVVYASVFGAILASLRSIKTHFIAFDTQIADLTAHLDDPVDLLFGTQLGGGTDIAKALSYTLTLVERPADTIVILLTDLFEGGSIATTYERVDELNRMGVQVICLLALSDEGKPSYDKQVAQVLASKEVPTFACTPDRFPDLMAAAMKGEDVGAFSQ
ncbi:MAG: VWA domain-containing protein [Bacteroidota bacterium]